MREAQTEFVGGPLDGKVLPVALTAFEQVPKYYRVPVPAHGDRPAEVLVYRREVVAGAKGRRRWRYAFQPEDGRPGAER
ncbi:hypothetical protein [Streptacidiphilus monticola]|jgi:hypothetical protein|uniref:Uncharacterized protein n=1 Tax=Streptacidiphilus monticola TaxID=2161674 RepID=A0ABW1FUT5_9ACTN